MIRAADITYRPTGNQCPGCNRYGTPEDHACYPNGDALTLWRPVVNSRGIEAATLSVWSRGELSTVHVATPDALRYLFAQLAAAMLDRQT